MQENITANRELNNDCALNELAIGDHRPKPNQLQHITQFSQTKKRQRKHMNKYTITNWLYSEYTSSVLVLSSEEQQLPSSNQNDTYWINMKKENGYFGKKLKWKLNLIVTANDNSMRYLYTYWKAPSTLNSSDVAWSPSILTASGAWTAITQRSYISSKPSPESTLQPAISHINSVNTMRL